MITTENVLLTSAVVLTVLISAAVLNYASKFIFVSEKMKKPTIQTFDPDLGLNCSHVCLFSQNPYSTQYDGSPCINKTLLQWYNPWVRHQLWSQFGARTKAGSRVGASEDAKVAKVANATEAPTLNVTPTEPPKVKIKAEMQALNEKHVEFAYSLLVGLLVLSGVAACWEVCKDTLKRKETAAAKAQERQCSLADFTIKRHLRRESQQQTGSHLSRQPSLELTAKVTQSLIHQSSLDRASPKHTSEAWCSLEFRRNSVPVNLGDATPGVRAGKRQSMDVPVEDSGLDPRRKPRHFIRRH